MIRNWMIHFGKEFTEELLEANNERPNLYLRTNTLKITRDELIEKLEAQNIKASKVNIVEEAVKS
jgi:tRNA and rRNA cytosine-C5-methylases